MADSNGASKNKMDGAQPSTRAWISNLLLRSVLFVYWAAAVSLALIAIALLVATLAQAVDAAPRWWVVGDVIAALRAQISGSPTIFIAVMAGALSVPIVLYRARLQQHTVDVAAANEENVRRTLDQQRKAARRQELTDLRLRATEMLGATKTEQELRWAQSEEPAPTDDDPDRVITKRTRIPVTVAKPNIEVRVAGIGILEEVAQAKDPFSGDLENHWPVMETLLAYVRTVRKPLDVWDGFADVHPEYGSEVYKDGRPVGFAIEYEMGDEPPLAERIAFARAKAAWVRERIAAAEKPGDDVAAISTVLRRRTEAQQAHELGRPEPVPAPDWDAFNARHGAGGKRDASKQVARANAIGSFLEEWRDAHPVHPSRHFDLTGTPLQGAQLAGAPLRRLNLVGARLEGATLGGVHLEGANLHLAHLEGARLGRARLEGANLSLAHLEAASLHGARLKGADLSGTQLEGANLYGARLKGADLSFAQLEGACLAGVVFIGDRDETPESAGTDDEHLQKAKEALASVDFDKTFGDAHAAEQLRALDIDPPIHWDGEYEDYEAIDRAWAAFRKERDMPALPRHERYEAE